MLRLDLDNYHVLGRRLILLLLTHVAAIILILLKLRDVVEATWIVYDLHGNASILICIARIILHLLSKNKIIYY